MLERHFMSQGTVADSGGNRTFSAFRDEEDSKWT
jgi:hypothetical protein